MHAQYASARRLAAELPDDTRVFPPRRADAAEVRRRIEAGEWVVDLRNRTAFAVGYVAGTLNFGLDGGFATYLGWLIPSGTPLTVLGMGEVPEGEVWVHCASGYRASIAASLLAATGRRVVPVDDDYSRAAPAGLPVVTAEPVSR